ncbi:hypothetical protein JTB14_033585 [Gonioctena quinquepunctata]|nr:hypothetical protein JTB14_033585 [Gonioctena quinquepunctata]
MENSVIKCLVENGRSEEDDRAIEIMENTIKRVENHFEIGFLGKNENVTLPDSRALAMNRQKYRKKEKTTTYLEVSELDEAGEMLVKYTRSISFTQEISDLKNKKFLEKSSRLHTLIPFVDKKGILRIKGKLKQSHGLNFFQKHPAILDPKRRLTKLLIENYQVKLGHQGQEPIMN